MHFHSKHRREQQLPNAVVLKRHVRVRDTASKSVPKFTFEAVYQQGVILISQLINDDSSHLIGVIYIDVPFVPIMEKPLCSTLLGPTIRHLELCTAYL